jgi:DNA-binding beta-propeller fold protein YncE
MRIPARIRPAWCAAALVLLAACGEADGRSSDGIVVDTLAGGVVRVVNPDRGSWEGGAPWKPVETLRIGSVDGDGPDVLAAPVDVEADALGRLYVLDAQAMEIRVFDPRGRHVRSFAREGAGPGELRQPAGMTMGRGGELWVMDFENARYSVYDTAGTFLRQHIRHNSSFTMPWPGMVDVSGRLHDVRTDRAESGEMRDVLLRFDRAVERPESFPLPHQQTAEFEHERGSVIDRAPVPFAPRMHWALAPDGRVWSGFSDRYRLEVRETGGRTMRVVEKPFAPVAVSGAEMNSVPALLRSFTQQGGRIDMSRVPKTKPAFTSLRLDDRGYAWVQPTLPAGETGLVFDVFDPEGRYVGRVALPVEAARTVNVVIRGDRVYAVVMGEMDEPQVVGFRLEGRAAE